MSVDWSLLGVHGIIGTAADEADFAVRAGTLTFAHGEVSRVLSVPLRQRWDDGSRWECSGHVLEACRRAGNAVHKVPGGRRTLTPGHVESLLFAADGRLMEMGGG